MKIDKISFVRSGHPLQLLCSVVFELVRRITMYNISHWKHFVLMLFCRFIPNRMAAQLVPLLVCTCTVYSVGTCKQCRTWRLVNIAERGVWFLFLSISIR